VENARGSNIQPKGAARRPENAVARSERKKGKEKAKFATMASGKHLVEVQRKGWRKEKETKHP